MRPSHDYEYHFTEQREFFKQYEGVKYHRTGFAKASKLKQMLSHGLKTVAASAFAAAAVIAATNNTLRCKLVEFDDGSATLRTSIDQLVENAELPDSVYYILSENGSEVTLQTSVLSSFNGDITLEGLDPDTNYRVSFYSSDENDESELLTTFYFKTESKTEEHEPIPAPEPLEVSSSSTEPESEPESDPEPMPEPEPEPAPAPEPEPQPVAPPPPAEPLIPSSSALPEPSTSVEPKPEPVPVPEPDNSDDNDNIVIGGGGGGGGGAVTPPPVTPPGASSTLPGNEDPLIYILDAVYPGEVTFEIELNGADVNAIAPTLYVVDGNGGRTVLSTEFIRTVDTATDTATYTYTATAEQQQNYFFADADLEVGFMWTDKQGTYGEISYGTAYIFPDTPPEIGTFSIDQYYGDLVARIYVNDAANITATLTDNLANDLTQYLTEDANWTSSTVKGYRADSTNFVAASELTLTVNYEVPASGSGGITTGTITEKMYYDLSEFKQVTYEPSTDTLTINLGPTTFTNAVFYADPQTYNALPADAVEGTAYISALRGTSYYFSAQNANFTFTKGSGNSPDDICTITGIGSQAFGTVMLEAQYRRDGSDISADGMVEIPSPTVIFNIEPVADSHNVIFSVDLKDVYDKGLWSRLDTNPVKLYQNYNVISSGFTLNNNGYEYELNSANINNGFFHTDETFTVGVYFNLPGDHNGGIVGHEVYAEATGTLPGPFEPLTLVNDNLSAESAIFTMDRGCAQGFTLSATVSDGTNTHTVDANSIPVDNATGTVTVPLDALNLAAGTHNVTVTLDVVPDYGSCSTAAAAANAAATVTAVYTGDVTVN